MTAPARYPPAIWRPVTNTSGSMTQPTRGFIPHVQVGTGSLYERFNTPATQVSSHLWLSKIGMFEQYVPFDRKAWAQAAGNPYWISCECEGLDTEDYTPIQVRRLGEFYAWGMAAFDWPSAITDRPDGRGIGTHVMGGAAWGGHTCPGPVRAARRPDILAAALSLTPSPGDDVDEAALRRVMNEGTGPGQTNWAGTSRETLNVSQHTYNAAAAAADRIAQALDALSRIEQHLAASTPTEAALTAADVVTAVSRATDPGALADIIAAAGGRLRQLATGQQ